MQQHKRFDGIELGVNVLFGRDEKALVKAGCEDVVAEGIVGDVAAPVEQAVGTP